MTGVKTKLLFLAALLLAALSAAASAASGPAREGLQLWLDASDAGTLEVQDNVVTRWRDKSGADHHATAVGKPTTRARQIMLWPMFNSTI